MPINRHFSYNRSILQSVNANYVYLEGIGNQPLRGCYTKNLPCARVFILLSYNGLRVSWLGTQLRDSKHRCLNNVSLSPRQTILNNYQLIEREQGLGCRPVESELRCCWGPPSNSDKCASRERNITRNENKKKKNVSKRRNLSMTKCEFLERLLREHGVDVLAVACIRLSPSFGYTTPGYPLVSRVNHEQYGIMTYTKDQMRSTVIKSYLNCNNIHISLKKLNATFIANVYKSPRSPQKDPPHSIKQTQYLHLWQHQ